MAKKIAIIGCGAITKENHLPAVLRNQRFELVALVDKDLMTVKRLMQTFGIDTFSCSNIEKMPPIDAALVAVPPHLHAEVSIKLMEKGVHVLCEKPIATNSSDAEKMLKTMNSYRVVLLVGIHKYYYPNTRIMLDILRDGYLGEIQAIQLENGVRSSWDAANPFRFDPEYSPGGVLFEYGIHWIYRLIHWFGYPDLNKFADDRIDGVEANAQVECVFNKYGQRINCRMYFSYSHPLNNRLAIYGKKASAEIYEDDHQSVYIKQYISGTQKTLQVRNQVINVDEEPFEMQLDSFADLINQDQIGPVQTDYAYDALRFIEECYENRVSIDQPWVFLS